MTLTLTIPQIFTETRLQAMLNEMYLPEVSNQLDAYHSGEPITENVLITDSEGYMLDFHVKVFTSLNRHDNIEFGGVEVSDIQIWYKDETDFEVTEQYQHIIWDAVEKRVEELI